MGVEDAVPNRLGVAVEAAERLVKVLGSAPGCRVGVVAFAGRGVIRCPLTENLGAVIETLKRLRPGDLTPGGTNLAAGVRSALDSFDEQEVAEGRTVVVFSDGEDHADTWRSILDDLSGEQTIIHTVAIGDAESGHPVPVRTADGSEAMNYQGSIVLSKRSDAALKEIASATGGAFIPLGLAMTNLGSLYESVIRPGALLKRAAFRARIPADRYPMFLLAALGFALFAVWPIERRVPLGHLFGCLAVVALAIGAAPPLESSGPELLIESGRSAFESGRFEAALEWFQRAVPLDPASPVPIYNAGAALFQLGRFEEAEQAYQLARTKSNAALTVKIDFSLGNTALARGELFNAIKHYDACIASTTRGADLDEVRHRAAANRRFVEEQSRKLPSSTSGRGGSSKAQRNRTPSSDPQPETGSGQSDQAETGGETRGDAAPNARGPGAEVGTSSASPPPGSHEDRLARAVQNVRDNRRRRLNPNDAVSVSSELKDW
jgi:Ca-activated chloride channel family protein